MRSISSTLASADGELHDARGDHGLVGGLAVLDHQLLEIVDELQELALGGRAVDDGNGGDHRSGQRPAPGLVDAGDPLLSQSNSYRKLGISPAASSRVQHVPRSPTSLPKTLWA